MPEDATLHEVLLDLSRCSACSGCAEICPEIFGWDEDLERPFLKRQFAAFDELREAIAMCPKRCIGVEGWDEEPY